MKLILTQEVTGLGSAGDVVEVKDGYGRNFLIPRGFGIRWTRGGERQIESIKAARASREVRDLDHAKEIKATLEALGAIQLTGKAAAGSKKLFGSITAGEIVDAIKAQGGPLLDKRVLDLRDHIKTVGKHSVNARLHPNVKVDLRLEVKATAAN